MIKLYDSELRVMDILWKEGDTTAKQLVAKLNAEIGWSRATTYTILKKLIDKNAVQRTEPNFVCHALITREQAQEAGMTELIDKMFDGSPGLLMTALLKREDLPPGLTDELRRIVDEHK